MRGRLAILVLLGGCQWLADGQDTDTDGAGGEPNPVDLSDVTWHEDLRPIVDRSCLDCHDVGGIGPITLRVDERDTDAPDWASLAVASVLTRSMPPWDASDDCHPIAGSRALSDNHRKAFQAWADQGYRLGDPDGYVRGQGAGGGRPDLGAPDQVRTASGPYAADRERPDDYHCLPLGSELGEDLWLRGIQIVPDQEDLVHHAILFQVPPEGAATVAQRDAAHPGPGYPCFGGPSDGGAFDEINLYTFVPGNLGEFLAEDEGRLVGRGSRLVMQVHYNTLALPEGQAAPADRTEVHLWEHDTPPPFLIDTVALNEVDLFIPAGNPKVTVTRRFEFGARADVVAMMPHMHYLGASLRVEAVEGASRRCIVDIPEWDFDWQQTYRFPDGEPFDLRPTEAVELTCVYDNSAANQPTVGGVRQEPRDVTWGEGTLDEMCLAYAHIRLPSGQALGCQPFLDILEDCPNDEGSCWLDGLEQAVLACGPCPIDALAACREQGCGTALLPLTQCLDGCQDGQLDCLIGTCEAQAESYLACASTLVRAGSCDPYLSTCGITP